MNMADMLTFKALRGQLRRDEPMSRHVSWRAGGAADRFYVPADLDDLSAFLSQLPESEPLLFVGLGSNLLVRDGGWRGTVILTHGASRRPAMDDGMVYADAGVASPKVARFAAQHHLEGAEFLAGIPARSAARWR
jgi:UDP-N-acetylmuramate dehydrogenase